MISIEISPAHYLSAFGGETQHLRQEFHNDGYGVSIHRSCRCCRTRTADATHVRIKGAHCFWMIGESLSFQQQSPAQSTDQLCDAQLIAIESGWLNRMEWDEASMSEVSKCTSIVPRISADVVSEHR
ncbi:unnamed protein product [Linum trigynum]|uniref:Uncharacterized protein n=1 Tax=Linum trigynum TaxID=586398 RepID=A0AAV2F3X4_9ROSI